jgi:hypothetical protein
LDSKCRFSALHIGTEKLGDIDLANIFFNYLQCVGEQHLAATNRASPFIIRLQIFDSAILPLANVDQERLELFAIRDPLKSLESGEHFVPLFCAIKVEPLQ